MKSRLFTSNFLILLLIIVFPETFAQENTSIVEHPEWSYNSVIYEVNLRQYTVEGTFKAFEEHLPRLKGMGVEILWLMPIHPIGEKNRKGTFGSYYAVKDYRGINPEHGTYEDFRNLVDKIHEMDMYVIIDWVANHTAWDNVWVEEHPEFYSRDSQGNFVPPVADWSDVIDLNYENKKLWTSMIDAMKFWVEEYDIDGYRCDVAGMIPVEFWIEARKELYKIKPVFMLAEAWEPELHQAFDMTYSWDIHHIINDIASGKKNADDLRVRLKKENEMYPESAFRMQFTSNHDENSWNGTVFERLGDAAETYAALTFIIPGMPLIYSGQEAGLDKRLQFFEKDPIEWKESKFQSLYTALSELKKKNKALLNGEKGGELKYLQVFSLSSSGLDKNLIDSSVFVIEREGNGDRVLGIFNLSNNNFKQLGVSADADDYINIFTDEPIPLQISLAPWEYKIFYKE